MREKMEKFRAVCHSNGYPCGWEKMGLNNVSLMSASAVSGNISDEMSPAISASNHLMGQANLNKMDALIYFSAWQMERIFGSRKTKKKKSRRWRKERLQTSKDKNKPFTIHSATRHAYDVCVWLKCRHWQEFQLFN